MKPVVPVVNDIAIEVVEMLDDDAWANRDPWAPHDVQRDGQEPVPLQHILTQGELGTFEVPRALHSVSRTFDPPALLLLNRRPVARLRAAGATVGSSAAPPLTVTVGGLKSVAWMLRDAISSASLWFGEHGKIWSTDS